MADEMGERASGGDRQHEGHIAPRPEAARQRGSKWQKPSQINADMQEVRVQKGVTEKRPQIGAEPSRKRAADDKIDVVTRWDEGESKQETHILVIGQDEHAQGMHEHQRGHRRDHGRRHIEHRF